MVLSPSVRCWTNRMAGGHLPPSLSHPIGGLEIPYLVGFPFRDGNGILTWRAPGGHVGVDWEGERAAEPRAALQTAISHVLGNISLVRDGSLGKALRGRSESLISRAAFPELAKDEHEAFSSPSASRPMSHSRVSSNPKPSCSTKACKAPKYLCNISPSALLCPFWLPPPLFSPSHLLCGPCCSRVIGGEEIFSGTPGACT